METNPTELLSKPIRCGEYNPSDYRYLTIDDEIRDLWKYIEEYQPKEINLLMELHCFIPDYIPAVGDPDVIVKPPRPDGQPETLGIKEIDEVYDDQSDPRILLAMLENSELSDIFQSVEYEPKEIELEVNLKCFIPDYIPALDSICLHLQPPRPDGKDDGIGKQILHEPLVGQSDPTILYEMFEALQLENDY